MIECHVTQGCEAGLTVRQNGNVDEHSEIVLFLFSL